MLTMSGMLSLECHMYRWERNEGEELTSKS